MAESLDWTHLFHQVCESKHGILTWSLPEPWVQAELFSLLHQSQHDSDWVPINHEVPYVTYLPVKKPEKRNLQTEGAVKWGDMAMISNTRESWCWLELKVRKLGEGDRGEKSDKSALDAIKQDVAALVGMDIKKTVEAWTSPDASTKAYWFEEVLAPRAATLKTYSHRYVMVYLHLFGAVDETRFSKESIKGRVESWVARKSKVAGKEIGVPDLDISIDQLEIDGRHSLVTVQWSRSPEV